MHTTKCSSGVIIHHNGDYSGDMIVHAVDDDDQNITRVVRMKIGDFKEVVAGLVRQKKLEELESMSDDEFLGLKLL
jgi:hypothetical protein